MKAIYALVNLLDKMKRFELIDEADCLEEELRAVRNLVDLGVKHAVRACQVPYKLFYVNGEYGEAL